MDLVQSAVLYSVMTLVSTYLVAFAYKNVKFVLKHKVAQKREDAVSKEVTRKLSEADNRKMSRKEKDERVTNWVDAGNAMDVAYLDFSKAFNKVPHDLLANKLVNCGLCKTTVRLICYWLIELICIYIHMNDSILNATCNIWGGGGTATNLCTRLRNCKLVIPTTKMEQCFSFE
uniref:Translocon-associated protein subunit gamma n=1 Tax=Anolis carolinensis TaxID=28377 RepID=A0A803T3M3_ANOCA